MIRGTNCAGSRNLAPNSPCHPPPPPTAAPWAPPSEASLLVVALFLLPQLFAKAVAFLRPFLQGARESSILCFPDCGNSRSEFTQPRKLLDGRGLSQRFDFTSGLSAEDCTYVQALHVREKSLSIRGHKC